MSLCKSCLGRERRGERGDEKAQKNIFSAVKKKRFFSPLKHTRTKKAMEFEDVLTNQPVVIDNVLPPSCCGPTQLTVRRVLVSSRLALQAMNNRNVSSHPCKVFKSLSLHR